MRRPFLPFLLLAVLDPTTVRAETRPPPINITCPAQPIRVYSLQDSDTASSCLWGETVEFRYKPSLLLPPGEQSPPAPPPLCAWYQDATRLVNTSDWQGDLRFTLPRGRSLISVQCSSPTCAAPACLHHSLTVQLAEPEFTLFLLSPALQYQSVEFGWCALLSSSAWRYVFRHRPGAAELEISSTMRIVIREARLPRDQLQACAQAYTYWVSARYPRLGQYQVSVTLNSVPPLELSLLLEVKPSFLHLLTTTSRSLSPTEPQVSLVCSLTPLEDSTLAYQVVDRMQLGGWVLNVNPLAMQSNFCIPLADSGDAVARIHFLLESHIIGPLAIDLLLSRGVLALSVNKAWINMTMRPPQINSNPYFLSLGFYFSSWEEDGALGHYLIFEQQGITYVFQIDVLALQMYVFKVHLYLNFTEVLKPLSDMNIEVHLFNSGPAQLYTLFHVVWYIPLQHPMLQCQWSFVLEVYSARKAYLLKNTTYTYNSKVKNAEKYIPRAVLPFDPNLYASFVATVNFTKSGQKPVVLKTYVGSYASKGLETSIECYKLHCNIKKFGIQKPIELPPTITLSRGYEVTLYLMLEIDCPSAELKIRWRIYQLSDKTTIPDWGQVLKVPAISPIDQCSLHIPRFVLDYGLYLFNVSVEFVLADDDSTSIYQSDSVIVKIIEGALHAKIVGGLFRSVGFGDTWELNGLRSIDPDSLYPLDGLSFTWYCTQNAYDYATMTLSKNAECSPFQNDLKWVNPYPPIQIVYPAQIRGNRDYYFRLVITKGNKTAYADQTIRVVPGEPPQLTAICIENCDNILILTERFTLSGKCLDCEKHSRPEYEWSLYQNTTEVQFDWATYTTTGRFKPYMSINALSFLNFEGKSYTLVLKLTTWTGAPGFFRYHFFVNSPPRIGNCNIQPDRGISLVTLFAVHCNGFSDENLPLFYKVVAASKRLTNISSLEENTLGTIVYFGYDPVSQPRILPIGDSSENYRLQIYVFVYDSLSSFSQTTLFATVTDPTTVTPEGDMLNELVALTSGSTAPMTVYLATGDNVKAGNLIYTVASVLNNYISSEPVYPFKDSRVGLREHLLNISVNIVAQDIVSVNQIVAGISEITENGNELNMRAQQLAVGKLIELGTELTKFRKEIIGSEQTEQLSTGMLTALSNVMTASLLNVDKANIATIPSEKIKVLKQILSVIEAVEEIVMYGKVPGGKKTVMETENWIVHLKKEEKWDITSTFLTKGDCNNCFFPALKNDFKILPIDSVVSSVFYEFKVNPFPWLHNDIDIETMITGFQMSATTKTGEPMNLIPEKVDMIIARKNETVAVPVVPVIIGPDPIVTGIASGEVGFEFDMERSTDLLLQFFATDNIDFNVSLHIGYNSSRSPPAATFQIPNRASPIKNLKSKNPLFRIADPYLIKLPLKLIIQSTPQGSATSVWNITLFLQSNYQVPKYTDKLVNLSIFYHSCLDFDGLSESWNERSCQIGPLTNTKKTHCICNFPQPTLTGKGIAEPFLKKMHMFISAKLYVPPNVVDFRKIHLAHLATNLVALSAVLLIFAVYIVLAVWAMKKDKADNISRDKVAILADNDPFDKVCYLVTFYTGSRFGAGTTADVFFKLVGTFSESQVHLLKHQGYHAFLQCGLDTFLLTTKYDLGDLRFLRIWHNNGGRSPSWFLSRVKVEHMYTKHISYFMCRKWLAVDKDDGLIDRTFSVANPTLPLNKKDFFLINVSTNLEHSHMWLSIFALVMAGSFNRLQRLSCCLTMLMSSLLTNIVMFNVEKDQDSDETEIKYLRSIMAGLESSLVTVPVQLLVSCLFRYSQRNTKPNSYTPYHAYTEFKADEESIMPNDASFWVSHVQPRGWKEYLHAWYITEVSAESMKTSSQISASQTVSSPSSIPRRKFNNCVISESVANAIVTEEEEASLENTEPVHNHHSLPSLQTSFMNDNQNSNDSNIPTGSSKIKKRKNPFKRCLILCRKKPDIVLSWWCVYVSWGLVLIVSAVSAFFIILYGLSYGYEISVEWLIASVVSFFQSVLIIQTVKITMFSAIATFSHKYLTDIPWENRRNFLEIKVDEMAKDSDEMRELHYELVKIRKSKQYQPLKEDEITIMKKRNVIKSKAFIFFKAIVSHFIFLALVLNLAYSDDNSNVFLYNRAIFNQLSINLSNVDRLDHIYIWMNNVFLPLIHNSNKPTFLTGSWSKIVGLPRMRQVRAKHSVKNCFSPNSFVYASVLGKSHCLHRYEIDEEDRLNHSTFWKPVSSRSSIMHAGFAYEYNTSPWIYYSYGESFAYGSGGYTFYFFPEKDVLNSTSRLSDLQNSAWLDELTWAVLIELTVFNPDVHLFCATSVIFEASPLGLTNTRLSVHSFSLLTFDQLDTIDMFTYLVFIVFLLIYIADEIYTIIQQKKRYIKQLFNLINFCLKSVFLLAVCLTIVKFKLAADLLIFYSLHHQQFTPFHAVSRVDETLKATLGFLAFFTVLKTLQYARFFYDVRLAQRSIMAALPGICSMALVVAVYFFAYMALGYLVFGQYEWSHNTLGHSAQTVLSYCVSAFRETVFSENRVLGGIYLSSFMLVMICIVINLFQAVIISAYDDMKQPVYEEPSDEAEVIAFLVHKTQKIWASLTGRKPAKSDPEIFNSLLYGQPDREKEQALGLKTKKVNGKKMVYLLI